MRKKDIPWGNRNSDLWVNVNDYLPPCSGYYLVWESMEDDSTSTFSIGIGSFTTPSKENKSPYHVFPFFEGGEVIKYWAFLPPPPHPHLHSQDVVCRWIDVKDRLPVLHKQRGDKGYYSPTFLVRLQRSEYEGGYTESTYAQYCHTEKHGFFWNTEGDTVRHWMEFPEAPRER